MAFYSEVDAGPAAQTTCFSRPTATSIVPYTPLQDPSWIDRIMIHPFTALPCELALRKSELFRFW